VFDSIDRIRGRAFNLGGGPHNAVSLLAVLREIERVTCRETPVSHGDWRQGDQLYFVADTRSLNSGIGWRPAISWRDGIRDLAAWLARHRLPTAEARPQRRRVPA